MIQEQGLKQDMHKIKVPFSKENNEELSIEKDSSGFDFIKTLVVVIIVIIGSSGLAKAQFQWGVNAGVNASTLSALGNLGDDNALKVGFNTGVIAKYRFNDWLALNSGIDYQLKGEKRDENTIKNQIKASLSYLVLPVKAEFSASEKAGFKNGQRVFFATGPYFGYLLDSKQTISGRTSEMKDIKDSDFGWAFELGFEFSVMKTNSLQVSLNYDMGFSEIAAGMNAQNKTASFNFGFLF
jgi:long-subunit fatty acid transport protein